MDNCKKPSYEISIEEIRKNGGYYDINGLWNSIMITNDNKFLRERVETFIFKIDQNRELQVYLRLNDDNTYRIPGGSVTKGIPDKKQAYLECKEEARIIVKDMEYTGIHYIREFENCNEIGYNEPDKMLNFIKWHGTYNKVYIGFFEAEYHGDIKRIDQDNDMYNNGKFYLIKDILPIINDNHKPIFDRVIEYSKSIQDYKDDYFQITLEEYNDSTNRQRIQAEYETNIRNLYLDNKFLFKIKFLEKQELLNLKSEIKDNQEAIPIANYQFYDSNGFTQLRDFLTSLNNSKNNKIEGYGFVIPDEHSMSGMIYVKPGLVNEQQEIEQNPKNIQTVDNYSRTSRFSPTEIPTNSWVDDFYAEYKKYQQEEDKEEENKKALLDLGWDVDSGMSFKEAMKMADIIENKALSDKVIKIDENFIFNEVEELRYVYSDPDGEDILNENYIIDKKNAELDIDMWKKDSDHNILFITGLSGSGKSTYARQLAKEENATIIELDIFQCYDKFKNAGTRKNDISMKMVSEFLEDNPEMVDIDFSNIKLESFGDSFTKYFKWLLNKLHKSNERYIIEGIHIMLFIPYSDIKGEPIICIGTSMIKSFWRMWKREGLTHKDFIKYGKRYFLLYKEWERQYKNFQDSFNESYIEEASKSSTLFHLSFNNLDNTKLQPKIPSNFLTLNGYENNTEKRVCFSPSIKKCLRAMSQNLTGKELYVHVPISNKLDVYTPTIKEVPDSKITGEVWIKTPVKIKCIGKIKVDKASDNDGIEYKYGNNTAMLYDWDYHWVDKINESHIIDVKEGNIMNQKDIYYNKEKFDSGEINLCFITGHSGSGKSTMARNMSKDNIEYYELDDVLENKIHFSMNNLKEYGDLIYSFFKGPGKKYYYDENDVKEGKVKSIGNDYDRLVIQDFVKYAISYANSYKNKKYVIEGIWLYCFIEPSILEDYAVYIKGTSNLISNIRAAKRDSKEDFSEKGIERTKAFIGRAKNFFTKDSFKAEKSINKYRSYFSKKSLVTESSLTTKIKQSRLALTKNKSEVLTVEVLNKYKNQYRNLSHIKINQNTNGRIYTKNEKVVAMINTEKKSDGIIWIQGLEVFGDNQGQGFGYGLLDIAVNDLKATHLSVRKTNLKAKQLYENYGFTVYKTDDYMDYMKIQKSFKRSISESSLSVKKRNNFPDEVFGLPEKRKYPMPDKKHVLSAIKLFNFVDNEDEKELAENIKKKMKDYKIDNSHIGKNNRLRKYL